MTRAGDTYINPAGSNNIEWISEDGISPSNLYHLVSMGRPIIKAETLESVMHRGEASLAGYLVIGISEEDRRPVSLVVNGEGNNAQILFHIDIAVPYTDEQVSGIMRAYESILDVHRQYKELAGCSVTF